MEQATEQNTEKTVPEMNFTKVEPLTESAHNGCLNCPSHEVKAPMTMLISAGFGTAIVTKDGQIVYDENDVMRGNSQWDDLQTLSTFEALARKDPDHDWRVRIESPLLGREYQRHGDGEWNLISKNEGFA